MLTASRVSIALCIVACSILSVGQSNDGAPPFNIVDPHGMDGINLETLSPILQMSVRSKLGAIPFDYTLNAVSGCSVYYEWVKNVGKIWYHNCGINPVKGRPTSPGVGSPTQFKDGPPSLLGATAFGPYASSSGLCNGNPSYLMSHWVILSGDKLSSLNIPITYGIDTLGCQPTFTATTGDATGLTLTVTWTGGGGSTAIGSSTAPWVTYNYTIKDAAGHVTNSSQGCTGCIAAGSNNGASSVVDAHGNTISLTYVTGGFYYTDTLGQTALTETTSPAGMSWSNPIGTSNLTYTTTPLTQLTAFGCGGGQSMYQAHEASFSNMNYITSVNLPDGTSLGIVYELAAGSNTTGRISQLTLPTGGTIAYTYGAMDCQYHTPASLTRTTADGVTTYSRVYTSSGSVTTVLDPGKNKTVYTFSGTTPVYLPEYPTAGIITEVQKYQNTGTLSSPVYTLLTTDLYCYNANTSSCATATVTYPITQRDVYHTINSMSTSSRVKETLDAYGNTTSVARYDFGASTPTFTTTTTFGSWNGTTCVPVGSGIFNLPCDIVRTDSTPHTLAESRFTYNTTGSMTTRSVWTGTQWLNTTFVPNSNGTVASSTEPNGLITTYGYAATGSGGCNGLLQTSTSATVASGDVLTSAKTWNCDGTVVLSTTDTNGNGTSSLYNDPLFRLTSSTDPSGYTTTKSYTSTSVSSLGSFGSSVANTTTTVDGLGRTILVQTQQGPSSLNYDTVSSAYAFSGTDRQVSKSTPCTKTWGTACGSNFAVSKIDPMGRTMKTTDASGNGTVTYTYSNNDVGETVGPAPTGENTKSVHTEVDGVGRTKSSCSILSSGGSSCGQTMSGSGVVNTYVYTYASGSSTVAVTRGSQVHTTVYDALERVTSTTTPEAGTTQFVYDTASSACYSMVNKGDLVETIDNAGVHTCYAHDAAHRVTAIGGASGVGAAYCIGFIYGDNSYTAPTGVAVTYGAGRMVAQYTDSACNGRSSLLTDEWYSYDKNGRTLDMWESTPHSGGYYHTTVAYFANGAVSSLSGIPGYAAFAYGVDGEGRPSTAAQGSTSLVSGVTFDASSKPLVVSIGTSGDSDTYTYDANERMKTYTFSVNSKTDAGTLTWNQNGTLQQLAVVDGFNAGGTQTCTFGYDDVTRLTDDNCGSSLWHQTFAYDQYDNVTKTGNPGTSWIPGYNSSNNRYSSVGATYDADGRMTYDSFNNYTYDATYGKMTGVRAGNSGAVCGTSGTCITYDASGRAVEKNVAGTYSEILYSPVGETAIMSGASTVTQSYISLPGTSMLATGAGGNGSRQMKHLDWLGTVRLSTDLSTRAQVYDRAFNPYGEMYDTFGGTSNPDFTGDKQDLFIGLNDTPNREQVPSQGRWISPDPAGQGWNLYAYPTNPNSATDPTGLRELPKPTDGIHADDVYGDSANDTAPNTKKATNHGSCVNATCGDTSSPGLVVTPRDMPDGGVGFILGQLLGKLFDSLGITFVPVSSGDTLSDDPPVPIPLPKNLLWIDQIVNSHGWDEHGTASDFDKEEYRQLILETVQNAEGGQIVRNPEGRKGVTGFWNDKEGFVVWHDKNRPEQGTAFRPDEPDVYKKRWGFE